MYRGRALIIATSQYDRDPELTPLPSVVEDAAGLTKVLADPRIGNFLVTTCLESAAHECSERLEDFFSQGAREELQLLYISGHGVKDAEGELYFAVKNTVTRLLGATAVSSSFIKRAAKRSKARGIVTILDSCFSGAFLGQDLKAAQVGVEHHFREGRGRVVITASDSFQHALGGQRTGDSRHRPSLFSSHVIRGLASGEADVDGDGEVSSKDLYDYVQERMQREGSSQRPQRWDFKQDGPDLVVASTPYPPTTGILPPEVVVLAQQQLPSLRRDAIVRLRVLLSSDSPPMVLAARALLERLQADADPAVAGAAATVFQRPSSRAPAPPPRIEGTKCDAPARLVVSTEHASQPERQPGLSSKETPAVKPQGGPPPQAQTARGQARFSGTVDGKRTKAFWRAMVSSALVLIVVFVIEIVAVVSLSRQHTTAPLEQRALRAWLLDADRGRLGPLARGARGGSASTSSFRRCAECPEMIAIPAGNFMMGSPRDENGRFEGEGPQHPVHIDAFEVAITPVTRGEWRRYADAGHPTTKDCDWLNPGFSQTDEHPVVCVSWDEAMSYIAWLNQKSGQQFRLLTEAEYEYVDRAGTQTRYFWGDSERDLPIYANNNGKGTTPVGSLQPNKWGLFDTTGNVYAWTQDCWHSSYEGAPANDSAWVAACRSPARVVRGGSWVNYTWTLRCAYRAGLEKGRWYVGVRLARTP